MQFYEYTVIPAPARGEKVRGARTGAERFSYALLTEMNRMAANGWEYVRADVLPSEERSGLTGRSTVYHNLLVFRRTLAVPAPSQARPPQPEYPAAASPARARQPLTSLSAAACRSRRSPHTPSIITCSAPSPLMPPPATC